MAKKKKDGLEEAVEFVNKQFGKGAVMQLGKKKVEKVPSISTHSIKLDAALGVGGFPRGRIIEVFGEEGSGKTTLALHVVAEAQKQGGNAALVDAEHALDTEYARTLGVDVDRLLISQPDSGEQALGITEKLAESKKLSIVVIDSVAALVPRAELEGEMGDSHVGLQARLMSQAMRKIAGLTNKTNTTMLFINQVREKIGVKFGNPEVTSGGRALKFYTTIRVRVWSSGQIKDGETKIGHNVGAKTVKNKVAPPFRQVQIPLIYGQGFSREDELIELGKDAGIIELAGAWYSYGDERLGQGMTNARQFLLDHPDLAEEILIQVKESLGLTEEAE